MLRLGIQPIVQAPAQPLPMILGVVGFCGVGHLLANGLLDEDGTVLRDEDGSPLEDE